MVVEEGWRGARCPVAQATAVRDEDD